MRKRVGNIIRNKILIVVSRKNNLQSDTEWISSLSLMFTGEEMCVFKCNR